MEQPLTPIEFLAPDLLSRGYVTFVTAREGVGKTTLLTALLWQMSRPNGGHWLGCDVPHGPTMFINTDAPDGESRTVRHWIEGHSKAFSDGNKCYISIIEIQGGFTPEDLDTIKAMVIRLGVVCVVLDSYMAAFGSTDPNRLDHQMGPMQTLVQFAAETKVALVVTDHQSKGAAINGEFTAMGSVAKSAQARGIIALTPVAPKECAGLTVVKVNVIKQSFARRLEPFGIEIQVDSLGAVRLEPYELADEQTSSGVYRGRLAILAFLRVNLNQWNPHKTLLDEAIKGGNIKERMAATALQDAIKELGSRLEARTTSKRGAPKEYRLIPDPMARQEPEQPEMGGVPDRMPALQQIENSVLDEESFDATPIASNQPLHQISPMLASNAAAPSEDF
jgi:hypothetical protein